MAVVGRASSEGVTGGMVGELGRNMEMEMVRREPVSGSLAWPSPGPEIIGTTKQ